MSEHEKEHEHGKHGHEGKPEPCDPPPAEPSDDPGIPDGPGDPNPDPGGGEGGVPDGPGH